MLDRQSHSMDWILSQEMSVPNNPDLIETVWQSSRPPFGPYDKIGLHRIVAKDKINSRYAVLYLPGALRNAELGHCNERYNFRLYLANRGIDTYGLDFRWHAIGQQEIQDFSFMKHWTIQTFLDDIKHAIAHIKDTSGIDRVFLAGFSRGGEHTYYYVSYRWKEDLAGIIVMDGIVWALLNEPTYTADRAEIVGAFEAGDTDASREILSKIDMHSKLSMYANEVSLVPKLKDWVNQNRDEIDSVMNRVDASETDVQNKVNHLVASLNQFLSDEDRTQIWQDYSHIHALLADYFTLDRYGPLIQIAESKIVGDHGCNHPDLPYLKHLGEVDLPFIGFFATGNPTMRVKASEVIGGRDKELRLLSHTNHMDVMYGEKAQEKMFEPMYQWLVEKTV